MISPDGRYVAWGKRQEDKSYILKVADLSETPEPHLSNVRSYQPGARQILRAGRLFVGQPVSRLHHR